MRARVEAIDEEEMRFGELVKLEESADRNRCRPFVVTVRILQDKER